MTKKPPRHDASKKAHVVTDELTNANTNAVLGELLTSHAHPTNPPTHLTDT